MTTININVPNVTVIVNGENIDVNATKQDMRPQRPEVAGQPFSYSAIKAMTQACAQPFPPSMYAPVTPMFGTTPPLQHPDPAVQQPQYFGPQFFPQHSAFEPPQPFKPQAKHGPRRLDGQQYPSQPPVQQPYPAMPTSPHMPQFNSNAPVWSNLINPVTGHVFKPPGKNKITMGDLTVLAMLKQIPGLEGYLVEKKINSGQASKFMTNTLDLGDIIRSSSGSALKVCYVDHEDDSKTALSWFKQGHNFWSYSETPLWGNDDEATTPKAMNDEQMLNQLKSLGVGIVYISASTDEAIGRVYGIYDFSVPMVAGLVNGAVISVSAIAKNCKDSWVKQADGWVRLSEIKKPQPPSQEKEPTDLTAAKLIDKIMQLDVMAMEILLNDKHTQSFRTSLHDLLNKKLDILAIGDCLCVTHRVSLDDGTDYGAMHVCVSKWGKTKDGWRPVFKENAPVEVREEKEEVAAFLTASELFNCIMQLEPRIFQLTVVGKEGNHRRVPLTTLTDLIFDTLDMGDVIEVVQRTPTGFSITDNISIWVKKEEGWQAVPKEEGTPSQ